MNILILFATYSGGTQVVAQNIATILQKLDHTVTVKNPKQTHPQDILSSDISILCSPSWDVNGKEGQPHEDYLSLIENTEDALFEKKKFAVVGLGDSTYPQFCGAVDELEQYITQKKGELLIPSLRIDGFYFDEAKHTQTVEQWTQTLV